MSKFWDVEAVLGVCFIAYVVVVGITTRGNTLVSVLSMALGLLVYVLGVYAVSYIPHRRRHD